MIVDGLLALFIGFGNLLIGLLPEVEYPSFLNIGTWVSYLESKLEMASYFFPFQALFVVTTFAIAMLTIRFGISIFERVLNRKIMP